MTILTKALNDTAVLLVPVGNNVSRLTSDGSAFNQAVNGHVIRVTPKTITLFVDGSTKEERYKIKNDERNSIGDFNCGYMIFLTKEDLDNHVSANRIRQKLKYDSDEVSDAQALAIAKILNW